MSKETSATGTTFHREHPADRTAMATMREMLSQHPAADLGPTGRAAFDDLMARTPTAEGVTYDAASVGGVSGWWCRPSEADGPQAILYLHGGAYVVGSAKAYRHFAGQIAARTGAPVFVPDYGLAPERPFPAALEDAEMVYRGLAEAGVSRIAIVGDSAGGGLALVTAARMTSAAADESVPRPSAVIAMSPWTDLTLSSHSMETRAHRDPLLTKVALDSARGLYLAGHDPADPHVSPLNGALANLPPVLLHVGEDEILLDDSRRYADRLGRAGSTVELHIWEGMVHVFPANLALLEAAREAVDSAGEFLRRHLGGPACDPSTIQSGVFS